MYRHARVVRVMRDAEAVVRDLFARYHAVPDDLPADWAHARATTASGAGAADRQFHRRHDRRYASSSTGGF